MWTYYPDLLATPVPRYTSFPTAAEFAPGIGPEQFWDAVHRATGEISLYVHIPFCEKICWYCGCNTAAANRTQRLSSYLDALYAEIALVAEQLPQGARIRRIALGGGSPNAISPLDFVRLFDTLVRNFPLDAPVVSVELDPRSLTGEWEAVLAGIGATHASMGVQTFASRLQESIGRLQPLCTIDKGMRILRRAGITSMNFDLMYGLPGQTRQDVTDSVGLAVDYGADRIALFGYAHVPHLLPRQRRIDADNLPGPEERFAMAETGYRQLVKAGYVPVGFDHFALPGDPLAQAAIAGRLRRNFQGFTEDRAQVTIGLGASAVSNFPGLLVQNEKNSGRYRMLLSQGIHPAAVGKRRSLDDLRRATVVEDLLCRGEAAPDRALVEECGDRLRPYLERELACFKGSALVIPPQALPYTRSIAAAFDPYRQHSPRRFSSAV